MAWVCTLNHHLEPAQKIVKLDIDAPAVIAVKLEDEADDLKDFSSWVKVYVHNF